MIENFEFSTWTLIGFLGQACFSARFLIQWVASELKKKSIIPILFWYFSLLGGIILLIYAIHRKDIVIICGQAAGLVVYTRNLILISKEKKEKRKNSNDIKTN